MYFTKNKAHMVLQYIRWNTVEQEFWNVENVWTYVNAKCCWPCTIFLDLYAKTETKHLHFYSNLLRLFKVFLHSFLCKNFKPEILRKKKINIDKVWSKPLPSLGPWSMALVWRGGLHQITPLQRMRDTVWEWSRTKFPVYSTVAEWDQMNATSLFD